MKKFIVNTKMSEVVFNLPTNLDELSTKYLEEITKGITVAPNYSLIALVYHERLSTLVMTCRNKKKSANIGIVPVFVKTGNGDNSIVTNARVGQKMLIGSNSIQASLNCAVPANKLNIDYFAHVINDSVDKDLYERSLQEDYQGEVLFIDFRIVPNCDIIALYDKTEKVEDPYITVNPITPNAVKAMA